LAPSLKKNYLQTKEVLATAYAKSSSIKNFNKPQITSLSQDNNTKSFNKLILENYYFEDSDETTFNNINLSYIKQNIFKDFSLGIDFGYFFIKKENLEKYDGNQYGISLLWDNLTIRLGINKYKDFNQFVPSITYKNRYKKHSYSIKYTYQNALFYTFSLASYEKKINTHHLSISDYIALKNKKDIWANITLNHFTNSDTELIAQYDWRFYYDTFNNSNFSYHLALEGWYNSHSKPNKDFYSPNFSDSTLLRIDPQYIFSKYLGIKSNFGLGHSFRDKTEAYKLGISLFGNPTDTLSYSTGCHYSNSSRISQGSSYSSQECKIKLDYAW